jgi:hypothetical protein
MKIHVFLVMAIWFIEKSKMQRVHVPKPTHLKMNLNIHINTTELLGNGEVKGYATSTKLNKSSRIKSLLSRNKYSNGVLKETNDVSDKCKPFLKPSSHSLIKDTKAFECSITDNSVRSMKDRKDCGGLIKIKNGEPWYATKGEESRSKIDIDFYRTLVLYRIDLELLGGEWFNEIELSTGNRYRKVIPLTKGTTWFRKSIKIDPPSCTTYVHIFPSIANNTPPINNKSTKYGIQKLRLYGVRVEAACKMENLGGNYKAMECDEEEICIESSGKCIQGCQHSEQCSNDEYCNVKTYQCHRGVLKCGKILRQSSARIVNGEESAPHSRPWMVAIGSCTSCAGTLITDRHVLTAAHCLRYGDFVLLGKHNCGEYDLGQMRVKIKKRHPHPLAWLPEDNLLSAYDIAIVTLEKPVRFSTTILPACLPNQPSKAYVNSSVTAVGWGLTWGTGDQYRLREVDLTLIPMRECQKAPWIIENDLKTNINKDFHIINETHALCAGRYKETNGSYNYTGPQRGDSGSPLILKDPKTGLNTVIGVATLAPSKTEYDKGPYFVYADVKQVLPWILSIINA